MNTDFSFNMARVLALMPINEDKTSPEKWRFQRRGNITMLCATLVFMIISLMGRWQEIPSHSSFPAHTPQHLIDNLATGELFFLGPIVIMWVISLSLVLLQRWDLFQQPTRKKRGRRLGPRVQEGENPWKDDAHRIALESVLKALGKVISSSVAGIILHELIKNQAFTKRYNQESLATWMYNSYREYFDDFAPTSMTTPSYVDEKVQQEISKLFNSFIEVEKHKEIKEKK